MKLVILFIIGFIVFYLIRRLLTAKRRQPEPPVIRTVTEASAERTLPRVDQHIKK